jgi:predicted methyltransferase
MSALSTRKHCALAMYTLAAVAALAGAHPRTTDPYDAAVENAGRSAADLKRDSLDHPAEVLRLTGIRSGMKVADFLAADGYYSELLSYLVGPTGHVLMLNNVAFDQWSNNGWQGRIAGNRLPNVEHQTIDVERFPMADHSLDAMLIVKVYHDLYWVPKEGDEPWPKIDPSAVLDEIARVMKPGATLLLIDHSAKTGTGSADAGTLHRIDEQFARRDFEKHGFAFVRSSDVLRKSEDARDQITYKGAMLGKTDRFVMVFRRRRA